MAGSDDREAQQARNRQDASRAPQAAPAAPPAPPAVPPAQPKASMATALEAVPVTGTKPAGTFNGVPGGGELWKVDGTWWLAYVVPGSKPPVYMAWNIPTPEDLTAITGGTPKPAKTMTGAQMNKMGALRFGTTTELQNTSEHPFETFVADFEKESEIRPWLKDPEVLALTAMALLEGRAVTEAELKTTDWWRARNDQQRAWQSLVASNPQEARARRETARRQVGDALRAAGVGNAPTWLVNLLADRGTMGDWSESYITDQVRKLADPLAPGKLDKDIAAYLGDTKLDRTQDKEQEVRTLIRTWLGPAHSAWSESEIQRWAGILRNDPDGETRLITTLQGQRLALFPEHADRSLTYEDIAVPWRNEWQRQWGQVPDETDPLFTRIVRANDLDTAQRLLREEGVKRNVGQVVTAGLGALGESLGGGASGQRRAM